VRQRQGRMSSGFHDQQWSGNDNAVSRMERWK